ncbi:MAG: tRNA dimethylallyltransferase, partial [Campylobacterota bacterium]|nr:tRNA dimethylallyltransferase [Campylobacterota bacterium]
MIQLAIIGPTASGKSDLAIKIAKKIDAYILSIDSLSIYKEIDIVSAKPSKTELAEVKHFGIDLLNPDEYFSV